MNTKLTRRALIRFGATGIVAVPIAAVVLAERALGADLPELEESDPAAKALGYKKDATADDPGRTCASCQHYKGGAESGRCALFPKNTVSARGWCKVWSAG